MDEEGEEDEDDDEDDEMESAVENVRCVSSLSSSSSPAVWPPTFSTPSLSRRDAARIPVPALFALLLSVVVDDDCAFVEGDLARVNAPRWWSACATSSEQ